MPRNQSFCSVALAVIAGLVLISVFVWQRPTNSAEWAAWMQALGSIVAVGVAIWVPYKQRENQRRDEAVKLRGDKLDRLHLAEGAIQCAIDRVQSFRVNYQNWGDISVAMLEANIQPLVHIQRIISEVDDLRLLGVETSLLLREAAVEVGHVYESLKSNRSEGARETVERVMHLFNPEDLLKRLGLIQQQIRMRISASKG